jgi:hypothetical protein
MQNTIHRRQTGPSRQIHFDSSRLIPSRAEGDPTAGKSISQLLGKPLPNFLATGTPIAWPMARGAGEMVGKSAKRA